MDSYMGSITLFAFNWAPMNFALCDGAVIPIQQNAALFSLLGTNFGGNGTTNFGLPDLRGRVPVGQGQGPGLVNRNFASVFGQDNATLAVPNLPAHQHSVQEKVAGQSVTVNANSNGTPDKNKPQGAYWAKAESGTTVTPNYSSTHDSTMASDAVQLNFANLTTGATGSSSPFAVNPPSLTMNYAICTAGIYPSRP